MATAEPSDPAPRRPGGDSGAISSLMIQMFRDYTGRSPERAHTTISDDLVTCVLRDSLTKGEQKLVDQGEALSVLEDRRKMQRLMREEASAGVEKILKREVIVFLSDNAISPDVSVETWLLAPSEQGDPTRMEPARPD